MLTVCLSGLHVGLGVLSYVFFCKQKTAYEMRISDWSSDVCSSDLEADQEAECRHRPEHPGALVDKEIGDQAQYAREHTEIDDMAAGQHDRLAGHVAVQLQKGRSEEHTSELQSLMRISYAVFCLKKKKNKTQEKDYSIGINKNRQN